MVKKLFVIVPKSITSFEGATVSTGNQNKIYFEEAKNTIWLNGTSYGIDPDTAKKINDNATSITDLQVLLGKSKLGDGEQTIIARVEQLEQDAETHVLKTTTIAGVDLQDNITSEELTEALNVVTTTKKGLMSSEDKTKLDGVESGAQVNVIEHVEFNGSELVVSDKKVSISAVTDVKVGSTSIVEGNVANIATVSAYDANTNKIVTQKDIEGISGSMHFVGIVADLSEVTTPKNGDVVLIGTKEYVYNGTEWQELGDEGLYVAKTRTIAGLDLSQDRSKAEMLTALNVEDGAQVNVIEGVQVNGTELNVTDKKVNVTIEKGDNPATIKVNGAEVAVGDFNAKDVVLSDSYVKADQFTQPAVGDTLDVTIGKLSKGIEEAAQGGVQSIGGKVGAILLEENAVEVELSFSGNTLSAALVNGGVSTEKVEDSAITTSKIANGAVTNEKLQNSSITIAGESVQLGGSYSSASAMTEEKLVKATTVKTYVDESVANLDSEVTSSGNEYLTVTVTQTDGKLTGVTVEFDPWEVYGA